MNKIKSVKNNPLTKFCLFIGICCVKFKVCLKKCCNSWVIGLPAKINYFLTDGIEKIGKKLGFTSGFNITYSNIISLLFFIIKK